jgi:tetratricopeptide (TPR) repeat protein
MSNRLDELQRKCRKYHMKKAVKIFGILVVTLSLPVGAYFVYDFLTNEQNKSADHIELTQVKKQEAPAEKKGFAPSYVLSVSPDAVEKSVEKIRRKAPAKETKIVEIKMEAAKPLLSSKEAVRPPAKETQKKSYFQEINADKPLEDWIEKYNQKRSYALAIYIAKQYYLDTDYKQAGIWAKRANQLDRNQEEAWLLYAKSVYALNNKEKAIRILNIYLQYKESSKAEFLLSEWSN